MAKKLSTSDILKAARAQAGQGGEAPAPTEAAASATTDATPAAAAPPAAEPVAATPAPSAPAAPTSAAPKSTKDILAAARAQSGGAAPSAPAAPKATPAKAPAAPAAGGASSTKDILAAARAQTAGAAPAAGGAKSTSDILAAARAQSGKAAAPAAAGEKPAKAAVAKAAPAAAAAPAGARPSVQEMLKAAREGKGAAAAAVATPAAATAVKPAPVAPVIPKKPSAKAAAAEVEPRRGFLAGTAWVLFGSPFRLAWAAFAATMGLGGLATARFMMPNVLVEPPSKFKVGPPSDYPPASVATKWTAQYGVWLVHNDYNGKDMIFALQTVCTHLGCTPNWLEGERKFKCPCHGSGFYITGINFEGPAPRPLERMAIRLSEDGALEVDKSRKFQQELGQWNDPASFVEVA
ncbi:MAG TPA: ubiquinol-cytochrome c reductase iron-sulfur subunit [Planctomycetaceae bacterium]|nr:ubiquinol-cytochrome c reductase iron-sulfur subunit [Planctomycetaceae bacterium]